MGRSGSCWKTTSGGSEVYSLARSWKRRPGKIYRLDNSRKRWISTCRFHSGKLGCCRLLECPSTTLSDPQPEQEWCPAVVLRVTAKWSERAQYATKDDTHLTQLPSQSLRCENHDYSVLFVSEVREWCDEVERILSLARSRQRGTWLANESQKYGFLGEFLYWMSLFFRCRNLFKSTESMVIALNLYLGAR